MPEEIKEQVLEGEQKQSKKKKRERKPLNFVNGTLVKDRDSALNAWFFYAKDRNLLSLIATLPFEDALGDGIRASVSGDDFRMSTPGIMRFRYEQSIGRTDGRTGAQAKIAKALYEAITQGVTGKQNFEAPDLLMFVIAMASHMAYLEEFKRALNEVSDASNFDKYKGKLLVESFGFDADDLSNNLADACAWIAYHQDTIAKSFKVPKDSNILQRWMYLSQNYFRDGLESKSQYYVYTASHIFRFNGFEFDTGSALDLQEVPTNTGKCTFSQYADFMDKRLQDLQYNSDISDMSGAIYRVWGKDAEISYSEYKRQHKAAVYEELSLHQIHNLEATSLVKSEASFASPYQDDGILHHCYKFFDAEPSDYLMIEEKTLDDGTKVLPGVVRQWTNGGILSFPVLHALDVGIPQVFINIHSESPDAVDVIESTRTKLAWIKDESPIGNNVHAANKFYDYYSGSEIVNSTSIYTTTKFGALSTSAEVTPGSISEIPFYVFYNAGNPHITTSWNDTVSKDYYALALLSNFDWAPMIYGCVGSVNGSSYIANFHGDISNYTVQPRSYIARLNDRALWELLNVPSILAKITKS
jgi:hypothetical protein